MKWFLPAVVIVVGIAVAIVMWRPRETAEMPFPETLAMLQQEAVSIAKESYGITLDYSPASVEKVEAILGQLHAEYQKRQTTEGQRGLALAFGVYIGEVVKRETGGGRWERDHPVMGEGTMPLYWKGGASFPVVWCLKRLVNGDEDNVWHKYLLLVHEKVEKKEAEQSARPPPSNRQG